MVQESLVEYVSSQLKLGVARATVKSALVGAGWQEADVEDTLKKVEGVAKPAMTFPAPATTPAMSAKPSPASVSPAQLGKPSDAQAIRVSDLLSASSAASPSKPNVTVTPAITTSSASAKVSKPTMMKDMTAAPQSVKRGGSAMKIVAIVVIVLLAGLSGYFFWQNMTLAGKVASLTAMSTNVTDSVTSLTNQVAALNASGTTLTAEVDSLTTQNNDLKANLSFAAIPPIGAGTPTSETVSLSGSLTGTKTSFTLTTPYGVVAFVANAKTPTVAAALAPLLGSTSTAVTLTGTHVPGSQYLTVTDVNGSSVQ
jgi:cell division protein FtsB